MLTWKLWFYLVNGMTGAETVPKDCSPSDESEIGVHQDCRHQIG